ncbi:PREDICTED: small integral membrane protein 22 [Gekko japonicus]|uniref:Small integral membrane protein 22 n=1 Tax=Gekko japonicus TaxID=146911 RepID=A0ABM1KMG9_GEKJA|nr:PREDICTED: small integral membrane protein 22 [Gekko japonicus]
MASQGKDFGQQLSDQINDALERLATKEMFQTDWDIAAFAIFFTFIGAVLLLVLLVLIRCCCCCCCDCEPSGSYHKAPRKVGIDNQAMEP